MNFLTERTLTERKISFIISKKWIQFERRMNRVRLGIASIILLANILHAIFYSNAALTQTHISVILLGFFLLGLAFLIQFFLKQEKWKGILGYLTLSVDLFFLYGTAAIVLKNYEIIGIPKDSMLFSFSFLILFINFLSVFRINKQVVIYGFVLAVLGNMAMYLLFSGSMVNAIVTSVFIALGSFCNIRILFYIRGYWRMKSNLQKAYSDMYTASQSIQQKTEEITAQNEQINQNLENLETFQKDYTDSLIYAQKIQKALIENNLFLQDYFNDFFIYFRPKGFVTGDFYWVSRVGGKLILAVADCTGHGVPGAFMTILGYTLLNEIVNKQGITEPDKILNKLRESIIENLHQEGKLYEQKDGMDVAILQLDQAAGKIKFSGANNSLCYIPVGGASKDKKIFEFKGDRMPASFHYKMRNFSLLEFSIRKGDRFYMYTDGYIDQFGGETGKKFKSVTFRRLLLNNHLLPMQKQKEQLEKTMNNWLGEVYEQIDDITVVGLEV
ncbi:MAG: PP2C family protein-serine/threonine phosphatase [Bacteroidales bacterium]